MTAIGTWILINKCQNQTLHITGLISVSSCEMVSYIAPYVYYRMGATNKLPLFG